MTSTQHVLPKTLLGSLLLASAALLLLVHGVLAAPPPDAYADALHSSSNFTSANNALGAPNGVYAVSAPLSSSSITLDMGAGEEGTDDLRLH